MISNITTSAVGNALKIYLEPPPGTLKWVVLRNTTGIFPAYNDPNSVTVFDGSDESYMVDVDSIINGTLYYYCAFDFDGTDWDASAIVSATPACTYKDQSVDVLSFVRSRIDVGIKNEILIGTLTPKSGGISVLNAPPMFEETNWPVITVHVGSDGSGDRSIGDAPFPDVYDPVTGLWSEQQGWLARAQLNIVGWSKNPDERIALRKALRKIILGNLDVFDSTGIVSIDFSQQDIDDLSSYPAPVYQAMCSFSCEAPATVVNTLSLIADVNATAIAEF